MKIVYLGQKDIIKKETFIHKNQEKIIDKEISKN